MVPAPARLSTSTVWPSTGAMPSASTRLTMSVPPPGAKGTMIFTGRSG